MQYDCFSYLLSIITRPAFYKVCLFFFSESRVPVINLEDGSRLSGDDAPLKKNLEQWLDQHPGYMVDSRMEELEEGEIVSLHHI